jgi:CheY-like chemotaxis protein/HPt (histidine-containing phosphotransfer) domain-containing protein
MRLLVVEDNKINQMVAKGLLGQEGADIALAENGALGVQAVANMHPPFDAVLMDLQMPVMDGFEATRAIRQDLGLAHLPIIAMTANAMPSDREACLAVGMNDHMGKPFDINHLVATLQKLTGRTTPQVAPAPVATAKPISAPGDLDQEGALARVGGDHDIYATVLQAFASEVRQAPDQVTGFLAEGDPVAAARALHTLKGLSATVGARHLSAVAADLEQQVKRGASVHEHPQMLERLKGAITALVATLEPVLQHYADEQSSPAEQRGILDMADRIRLQHDLEALVALLGNSNMVALSVHALVQQAFGPQLGQDLAPLRNAMNVLDFAAAQAACEALLDSHCGQVISNAD